MSLSVCLPISGSESFFPLVMTMVVQWLLHKVCNTFFSVTLPLVHFETTCSSLNTLLARVTTFSCNR